MRYLKLKKSISVCHYNWISWQDANCELHAHQVLTSAAVPGSEPKPAFLSSFKYSSKLHTRVTMSTPSTSQDHAKYAESSSTIANINVDTDDQTRSKLINLLESDRTWCREWKLLEILPEVKMHEHEFSEQPSWQYLECPSRSPRWILGESLPTAHVHTWVERSESTDSSISAHSHLFRFRNKTLASPYYGPGYLITVCKSLESIT